VWQFFATRLILPEPDSSVPSRSQRHRSEWRSARLTSANLSRSRVASRLSRARRSAPAAVHRDLIIKLAAQHRLPAVYPYRFYAADGGLVSYGPDTIDPYRRAASYVDRILKGEKPADLPVQAPTKYELVINRKAAKSLDLALPQAMVARADEVID
jgi:ABC transporter substrate binding protein